MVTDHIHLLCEVPSTVLISDFIGKLKGSSSHEVNKRNENIDFAWHEGYSVFSVGRTEIDMIQNYIKKQKTHHKQK
jgi:REP element-mobilizing transposase RayT